MHYSFECRKNTNSPVFRFQKRSIFVCLQTGNSKEKSILELWNSGTYGYCAEIQ